MISTLKKRAFGITNRILKRDFSGNTGLALKNSLISFLTSSFSKLGSIIFVYLIMMRYLSQEVFGLYSLTLSTILLFSGLADLGIGGALVHFVSKNGRKSKGYIRYLFKIRLITTSIGGIGLIVIGYFLSKFYYNQPIFLGIIAGAFYLLSINLLGFFIGIFQGENNFKVPLFKEIIFQISRIVLVALAIYLTNSKNSEILIFWIIVALGISTIVSCIFLFPDLKKYRGKLDKKEEIQIKKYIIPLSASVLSGLFFGYIDTFMLGRYVLPEFIAYYNAAFSLIVSAVVFISFSAVLFPIFSKINKKRLDIALNKSILITFFLGLFAMIFTIGISPYLIKIIGFVTGRDYTNSLIVLKILSIILLVDPLIGILSTYYYSIGKPKKVMKSVIISTIINIALNLVLIKYFLQFEMIKAVWGVSIATVISKLVYLGLLFSKKSDI